VSKTPYFGSDIERIPPTSYEEGAPVSAYRALALRNNIQQAINYSCQHRINWVTQAPVGGVYDTWGVNTLGEDALNQVVYRQDFEHTWIREDWPTALDIKVVGLVGSGNVGDLTMYVRIVSADAPLNDPQAPALFTGSDSTTGANTTCTVEGIFAPNYLGKTPTKANTFTQITYDENGIARTVEVAMMRIEVIFSAPEDDTSMLLSVLVREFAWHHEAP
jgi:hypothetical protein